MGIIKAMMHERTRTLEWKIRRIGTHDANGIGSILDQMTKTRSGKHEDHKRNELEHEYDAWKDPSMWMDNQEDRDIRCTRHWKY